MKKAYMVYTDDGRNVYRLDVPAESAKKAREFVQGNGEIVAVKPGERNASNPISADYIANALAAARFGQMEIDLILRALGDCDFIA